MSFSNFLELEVLDHIFRNSAYTGPATVYVALHTANPAEDASGTEVSGTSYVRQTMAFSAAASGSISNSAEVAFPAAGSGGWGTATHFACWDAVSSGNMLAYGSLTVSKTVAETDVVRFAAAGLSISLD